MPLQDITNAKHLPVRGAASKLFASPQGKSKSTKAASPPSPAQLAAAYAVFTQQKVGVPEGAQAATGSPQRGWQLPSPVTATGNLAVGEAQY